MKHKRGLTIVEILMATGLFTIVVLGITQTVLAMHRYSRANLCKIQAHLLAVSYFEQLLGDNNANQLDLKRGNAIATTIPVLPLDASATALEKKGTDEKMADASFITLNANFYISKVVKVKVNETEDKWEIQYCNDYDNPTETVAAPKYGADNVFEIHPYNNPDDKLKVILNLYLISTYRYGDYKDLKASEINPPEGFQAIRMRYRWSSPTASNIANDNTWPSNELYVIRPINPDEVDDMFNQLNKNNGIS